MALVHFVYPFSWYNLAKREALFAFYKEKNAFEMFEQMEYMTAGFYSSAEEIIRFIESVKNPIFESRIIYDEISRKTVLRIAEGEGIMINSALSTLLGFMQDTRYVRIENFSKKRRHTLDTDENIASKPPKNSFREHISRLGQNEILSEKSFDVNFSLSSMYIYSSVVDNVIVGNTLAPLLRTVVVDGTFGDLREKEFFNPFYKDLSQGRIEDIEISIRDDKGQLVKFEFGKTLLKFQFRKKM